MKFKSKVIGIVSPAGFHKRDKLTYGAVALENLGFKLHFMPNANLGNFHRYKAGCPEARAQDLMQCWLDEEIELVWCVRGGYGSAEILPLLDWKLMKKLKPNLPVVGYSDITALHCAMVKFGVGLPVAAPMLANIGDAIKNRISRPSFLSLWDREIGPLRVFPANLTVLASMCGTPYLPKVAGMTVILEDIAEHPYRLDRCFNQLKQSGFFDGVEDLRFGHFTQCGGRKALTELFHSWLKELDLPPRRHVPYGHEFPFRSMRFDEDPAALDPKDK